MAHLIAQLYVYMLQFMKSLKQTCTVTERCPDNHKVRGVNCRTSCVINDPAYTNGMISSKLNTDPLLGVIMTLGAENH